MNCLTEYFPLYSCLRIRSYRFIFFLDIEVNIQIQYNPLLASSQEPMSGTDGWSARFSSLTKQYGKMAMAVYLGISLIDFTAVWAALRFGLNVDSLLVRIPFMRGREKEIAVEEEKAKRSEWGTIAVAYAIHKLLSPVRIAGTIAITPGLSRWFTRLRQQ